MSIENLEELFLHELKDILDAERQITKALPKMAKGAESEELEAAFEEHLSVTEEQIGRLETIFESMDKAARGKHCPGMEGLIKEGSEMLKEEEHGAGAGCGTDLPVRKRSSITRLRPTARWSNGPRFLGMDDAVELLETTLAEEKETDEKLTTIASELNLVAQRAGEQSERRFTRSIYSPGAGWKSRSAFMLMPSRLAKEHHGVRCRGARVVC